MTEKSYFLILIAIILIGFLIIALAANTACAEELNVRIVQASGGLRVRDSPSISGNQVYLLDECETVVVYGWQDGWALVGKNIAPHNTLGWVCGEYLR